MIDRTTKLRWRRRYRRSRQQVEDLGYQAEEQLEEHFIKRLNRLWDVRRFIIAWFLLLALLAGGLVVQTLGLSQHYESLQPEAGGSYSEGILGAFTNANPLYASGNVDSSVSRLIFAGLFKYDDQNHLVGDLAQSWQADDRGVRYTVKLRPDLTWQDGYPLTSDDVAFTYHVIQNPDAKSPLASSWTGVTVEAADKRTIIFTLPTALSAFPYSLTNGIVPQHLLDDIPMGQLRSAGFNTAKPVGAGPFKWDTIEVVGDTPETRQQNIALTPFEEYHGGAPRLSRFNIHSYQDEKHLVSAFKTQEINAMVGVENIPDEFLTDINITDYNLPLTSAVMAFFKTTQYPLDDVAVRKALIMAADQGEVIRSLAYPVIAVHEPFLNSTPGFSKDAMQFNHDVAQANQLLDSAGWKMGPKGIRQKDGQPLTFKLYSESTSEYATVTQVLQRQWRAVGADVQVILQADSDLQTTLAFHTYDALLYGISIGNDPDVFPYWHSSQADIRSPLRLNLSEYKNANADRALEAARSRSDPTLQAVKYKPFLDAWKADAPALALYQPRLLYMTHGQVFGLTEHPLNEGADRYSNVANWMIRQALRPK